MAVRPSQNQVYEQARGGKGGQSAGETFGQFGEAEVGQIERFVGGLHDLADEVLQVARRIGRREFRFIRILRPKAGNSFCVVYLHS